MTGTLAEMKKINYLMESDAESLRLELKTDESKVMQQAGWAGLKQGMRVADLGCGPGRTTAVLNRMVQPAGRCTGIDFSPERIEYATAHYKQEEGIDFLCRDIREPLADLGMFDFVWVRFVLEYYRAESTELITNILKILKPGGILCLVDLDNNCLNHYGIPPRLERTVTSLMEALQTRANFDPFIGRKLYSYLYDFGLNEIEVDVAGHHVIYGELKESDAFNWLKKVEIAPRRINFSFDEYENGYEEFVHEFKNFFADPRRFTYSPLVICRGIKP